ncbi:MAG: VENN motif pre-toxin domain-containing protein, partial [Snodgrassella sp.]|uniref:endonuclease toxin domain-containing protein n=1 Tax=Snodgrassella sp. TaxID=2815304 RepID=UPI0025901E70
RTADEQAQSWGIGGGKSRALNAVTSAVTGILGGQTNLQAATNALAPYAAELIGKQFGHGDNQNQAAQLVAHALLGAISASVNGGNAAAGAVGASAAELAAQYLIKQLPKDQYPEAIDPRTGEIDPNRLPESVKASIRDLSSAVATVSGGLTGGSLVNAQIAGVVGQNAAENNNLDILREEESKRELELATKYNWTSKQLTDYITNKSRGSIKGFADGAVEAIEGTANAVRHPVDTAKGIYGVISDPNAVFNSIEVSVKEWEELYAYALQTNPGLAGKMEGYLSGKVGGSLTGGYLVTGTAAKVVSTLAKSKYATKIKEIAKGAGKSITKPVTKAETGIEWGKGIQKQGMPWEDFVGKELSAGSRLPPNFKTFDYYDPVTKKAVSVKTLDTTTPAKIANPKQIFNTLKNNIDAAANFTRHDLRGSTVLSTDISSREIRLAVPATTNKVQWQQIHRAIDYGKSRGVKVIVTEVK